MKAKITNDIVKSADDYSTEEIIWHLKTLSLELCYERKFGKKYNKNITREAFDRAIKAIAAQEAEKNKRAETEDKL